MRALLALLLVAGCEVVPATKGAAKGEAPLTFGEPDGGLLLPENPPQIDTVCARLIDWRSKNAFTQAAKCAADIAAQAARAAAGDAGTD